MKKKRLALHWKILLGIGVGILLGVLAVQFTGGRELVIDWVKPFGTIFIRYPENYIYKWKTLLC